MNKPAPTIRSLAAACDVSRTTAALALKNSPLVAKQTREKVQAAAAEAGYAVDANISKLMAYLRRIRGERALCNLGWIHCAPRKHEWRNVPWSQGLYRGALDRAGDLGYALDEIWVREPGFKLEGLPRMLRSRGIEGVLLPPPLWEVPVEKFLPWEDLHGVLINEPHALPSMHRVDFDASHNIQLALAELAHLGYRRPGLAIGRYSDERSNFNYSGQFLTDQFGLISREHITPFWLDSRWDKKEFLEWFHRERPDALLVCNHEWIEYLADLKLKVPEDVGLIHLEWAPDVANWAGIDPMRELVGAAAMDVLTAHLARGEKGMPSYPKSMLIRGVWRMGETVRTIEAHSHETVAQQRKGRTDRRRALAATAHRATR